MKLFNTNREKYRHLIEDDEIEEVIIEETFDEEELESEEATVVEVELSAPSVEAALESVEVECEPDVKSESDEMESVSVDLTATTAFDFDFDLGTQEEEESEQEEMIVEQVKPVQMERAARVPTRKSKKKTGFDAFLDMISDKLLYVTGGIIALVLLTVITVVLVSRSGDEPVLSYSDITSGFENTLIYGEEGLTSLGEILKNEQKEIEEELVESTEYEEEEIQTSVEIDLAFVSIDRDLKVKFINKDTGKLIANVPFEVKVTDPDGKSNTWVDADMDGIIHKTDITGGEYKVELIPLEADKYLQYMMQGVSDTTDVKKQIAFEEVEIEDEIKDESEVEVDKEDSEVAGDAEDNTGGGTTLQDTVAWVESTVTDISSTYSEINKTDIVQPTASASNLGVLSMVAETSFELPTVVSLSAVSMITETTTSEPVTEPTTEPVTEVPVTVSVSADKGSIAAGETSNLTATLSAAVEGATYAWTSSSANFVITGNGATATVSLGSAATNGETSVITVTVTKPDTTTITANLTLTAVVAPPAPSYGTITIADMAATTIAVGASHSFAPVITADADKALAYTWAIDNTTDFTLAANGASATVTANGTATGKAATVTLTVSYQGAAAGSPSASKQVVVSGPALPSYGAITIAAMPAQTMKVGATTTLTPSVTADAGKALVYTWTASTAEFSITPGQGNATVKAETAASGKSIDVLVRVSYQDKPDVFAETTAKITAETLVETPLKTSAGLDVYVKVGESYVLATTSHYGTATQFFVKNEGYKYTGWQTLDGKVYYYDANGNKVTGDQVIQGIKYTFNSDGTLKSDAGVLGIDVSRYNVVTDWNAVKAAGVEYVIIRCGYRGYGSGVLVEDSSFKNHIQGATAAGLKIGIYFFSQAINEREAVEEASMVLNLVKGYNITYPIFIDVEYSNPDRDGRADSLSVSARTAVVKAFCQTIQNSGYKAGIYANKSWLTSYVDMNQLNAYTVWLAQYASTPTYTGKYDMWQYTDEGSLPGIPGDIDLNLSYISY